MKVNSHNTNDMLKKKNEGNYMRLSRKELQSLCKKYGLPANRSRYDLAKSLATSKDIPPRVTSDQNNWGIARFNGNENVVQLQNKETHGSAGSTDNIILAPVTNIKIPTSSFEFHVQSDEGINLFVDLNSSPSDWIEKLKNDVHIYESVCSKESRSFHEELAHQGSIQMKSSNPLNIDKGQIDDGPLLAASSRCYEDKEEICKATNSDGCECSLKSSTRETCLMDEDLSKHTAEQDLIWSNPNRNGDLVISMPSSSGLNGCKISCESEVVNGPKIDFVSESASNLVSDNRISLLTSEQAPKLNNAYCEDLAFQSNHDPPSFVTSNLDCSISSYVQMQVSESSSFFIDELSPCKNDGMGPLGEQEQNMESAYSIELNGDTSMDPLPTCTEKEEKSTMACGVESSVCSHSQMPFEKISPRSADTKSTGKFHKRRRDNNGVESTVCGPKSMVLRSSKFLLREAIPRRSLRLLPKN